MCGIWGFSSACPDIDLIERMIRSSAQRGGHSFGAYIRAKNEYRFLSWSKTTDKNIDELILSCKGANLAIGHFRLSTDIIKPHTYMPTPIVTPDYVLSHNGFVPDSCSEIDSLDLLPIIKRGSAIDIKHACIWLDRETGDIKHSSFGMPLFRIESEGIYICSVNQNKQ